MEYTNTPANQERYQALKAKYQKATSAHNTKVALARAAVELAEVTLKQIEDEWNEFNNNRPSLWTRELTQQKDGIINRRNAARQRLERKRQELAIAQVGEDSINEVVKHMGI